MVRFLVIAAVVSAFFGCTNGCVNDPTQSEAIGWSTDSNSSTSSAVEVDSTASATGTEQ